MNVGILTYHRAHNYGAFLQAYALCSRLNDEPDISCEIIDFRTRAEAVFYSLNRIPKRRRILHPIYCSFRRDEYHAFEKAQNEIAHLKTDQAITSDSLDEFSGMVRNRYDVIIAGSDEIWKVDGFRGFPTPYWLIGDLGCRKFAYAASARVDFRKLPPEKFRILKSAIDDFEFIGVRDTKTEASVQAVADDGTKVHLCCDPSFLYDFEVPQMPMADVLRGKARLDPGRKTIVLMANTKALADAVRANFSREYNLISVFDFHPGFINAGNLSPMEWMRVIKNADLMITTYFHGTCFSIIFGTPFVSFGSSYRSSKVEELFESGDPLSDRFIPDTDACLAGKDFRSEVLKRMKRYDNTQYIIKQRESFSVFLEALRKNGSCK